MARARSYLSKSGKKDPIGTFLNNSIAKGQQQARKDQKNRESSARRQQQERDRNQRRGEREREKSRDRELRARQADEKKNNIRLEKERAVREKKNTKMMEKKEKLSARLKLEFSNAKIPFSGFVISEIVNQAYKADVTAGQLKKTFIDPNIKDYSIRCLREYFESIVPVDWSLEDDLKRLIGFCCSELPLDLDKVKSSSEWCKFISICEDKNVAIEKDRVRVECLDYIQNSKVLFSEDLEKIWEKADSEDWSKEEILTSQIFLDFKKTKDAYKEDITNRIQAFM
jgi:hypothetical protein